MKKLLFRIAGILATLSVPLVFSSVARAAADTCTWTGNGSPATDSVAKTLTFDLSDPTNWTGCDNGAVPEAGDTLIFPANEAVVDPGNTLSDDFAWDYIVNNDLGSPTTSTSFAAIQFSGNKGTDCTVYDDTYVLSGNPITLAGDVTDTTTGTNCGGSGTRILSDITVSANKDY